ncbi:calcium-dependent protein kinase 27-like [Mercurialis annua]|uniref:calcium-dependent protein kinase 27-like n=1 Tax=Mercurialis annua TaxID=3986 RepID=UPI00215FD0EA|nr:calcium-dependent protein kinase 27-like [Mercurialis annua]
MGNACTNSRKPFPDQSIFNSIPPFKYDRIPETDNYDPKPGIHNSILQQRNTENFKKKFNLGQELGIGSSSSAFVCVDKSTGEEFACKLIKKTNLITKSQVINLKREIQLMYHLSENPNVASIRDVYEDSESVYIVMELCRGGELFKRLKNRGKCPESEAVSLIRSIITIVQSLHTSKVMHRDLKLDNFIFLKEEKDSPLKVVDFGFSTFFEAGDTFHSVVGTVFYVAPEVLKKDYGSEAEMWSIGVILYMLLSGVPPFVAESEKMTLELVKNGNLDLDKNAWPVISDSAKDLIRKMLDRDPSTRITATEALCHPWLRIKN